MTRWKREFREWAEREALRCWTTPRKPEHWHAAKAMSRIVDAEMRRREPGMRRALNDLLTYGSAQVPLA